MDLEKHWIGGVILLVNDPEFRSNSFNKASVNYIKSALFAKAQTVITLQS